MPTGVVPDDDYDPLVQQGGMEHPPVQNLKGFISVGPSGARIEVHLAVLVTFDTLVAEGFVGTSGQQQSLLERQLSPRLEPRLGKARKPAFSFPQQQHRWGAFGPGDEPVTAFF